MPRRFLDGDICCRDERERERETCIINVKTMVSAWPGFLACFPQTYKVPRDAGAALSFAPSFINSNEGLLPITTRNRMFEPTEEYPKETEVDMDLEMISTSPKSVYVQSRGSLDPAEPPNKIKRRRKKKGEKKRQRASCVVHVLFVLWFSCDVS
jgi:hypothetical protein